MNPEALVLIVGGLAVFVGAVVQGSVGFGLGLVGAPVLTLLDPAVMPGAIQVVNLTLPLFTLAVEWRRVDWRGVGFGMLGRLPGSVIGGVIVVYISVYTLGVFVGVMVLVAVGLTARALSVPRNGVTVTAAGFVSGITGTATGIGGPPIALVYQSAKGAQIRATLAMFFFLSAAQSLVILAVVDRLPARALTTGATLIVPMILGFLVSGPLRRYLDGGRVRAAILLVAAISALVLIIQSLAA
ncbi:sulfite exporter TauE/SafE family protein [Nonomuraea cavernae]|uniref:Probable membrane transporter protein n=1 Tax=Nonomuraea cavernae TaxID=2045107 RepID=A0A917YYW7_9ACTN|nr:sulfite exporter TauE/SafE family protein [Nonomuraea cavernae]MCA2187696.1 sulfite exporter TauE/SafE family protein [Nonomuraea cavernae]GGO70779.1 permease [Nonomuraea cavernae]